MTPDVWLITGISRGLGRALAEAVLARGATVVGTTRDGASDLDDADGRLHVIALDVTDPSQAGAAVQRALELAGRIDVLVNNAGHGFLGAVEETGGDDAAELFEVNFFGALRVTQAALPVLREQGGGHIVNISSIAGLAPMAGSGLYAATKAALGALSASLAHEGEPLGIRVTVVEPGAFRTEFLTPQSLRRAARSIDAYAPTSGAVGARLDAIAGQQAGDPAKAAEAIIAAVAAPEPPLHLVLGDDAVGRTRTMIEHLIGDLDRWESIGRDTAFADEPSG